MIRFTYTPVGKTTDIYTLTKWQEDGVYVKGFCPESGSVRTFRKDRIGEYLDGENLLSNPRPAPPPPLSRQAGPEIIFTGFPAAQKKHLQSLANEKGMTVRETVTKGLHYLCAGPNAGPSKVASARSQNVIICSQAQLMRLWETGELPDEEPEFL